MLRSGIVFFFVNITLFYFYQRSFHLPPKLTGGSEFSFRPVARVYAKLLESGRDVGSSLAVVHNGKLVLDMHGGYVDREFQLPWKSESIAQVFSTSHIASVLAFFHLKDKHGIALDSNVSNVLQECSLTHTTLLDLLTSQAGLSALHQPVRLALLNEDVEEFVMQICSSLMKAKKDSDKQLQLHYHTTPIILDAVVRKLDSKKRPIGRYFMEEIVWPNSLDMLVGLPRTQVFRTARSYWPPLQGVLESFLNCDWRLLMGRGRFSEAWKRAENWFADLQPELNHNPELNEIPLASIHLFTNANSLARLLFTGLLSDKVLTSQSREGLLTSLVKGHDAVLGATVGYSQGLMVLTSPKNTDMIGWLDSTGQFAFVDSTFNVTFSYVTNHMRFASFGEDRIFQELVSAIYACLDAV